MPVRRNLWRCYFLSWSAMLKSVWVPKGCQVNIKLSDEAVIIHTAKTDGQSFTHAILNRHSKESQGSTLHQFCTISCFISCIFYIFNLNKLWNTNNQDPIIFVISISLWTTILLNYCSDKITCLCSKNTTCLSRGHDKSLQGLNIANRVRDRAARRE